MTKQQERYYVVSESELKNLANISYYTGYCHGPWDNPEEADMFAAEAACRAREVVEDISGGWMEVGKR